jgi:hypothetical protein
MPSRPRVPKPRAVSPARIQALREESIQSLLEMEEALVHVRTHLKTLEATMRRARRLAATGLPALDIAVATNAAQMRAGTSATIDEIQLARHRARQLQFKVAAAEGASMAEIARGWGVSRQLVSRMVKEPVARRRKV